MEKQLVAEHGPVGPTARRPALVASRSFRSRRNASCWAFINAQSERPLRSVVRRSVIWVVLLWWLRRGSAWLLGGDSYDLADRLALAERVEHEMGDVGASSQA